jgi:hypothetical protein
VCSRYFGRVHSRYTRTVADLPWHGVPMSLHIRVRRFFCENSSCKRAIFAERVPEVAAYARKSDGLQTHSCFDDTRRTIIAICYQMLSRNRIHRLRHASIENFDEHFKSILECHAAVPTRRASLWGRSSSASWCCLTATRGILAPTVGSKPASEPLAQL